MAVVDEPELSVLVVLPLVGWEEVEPVEPLSLLSEVLVGLAVLKVVAEEPLLSVLVEL